MADAKQLSSEAPLRFGNYWLDAELAKVVAARVLRGHRVQEPGWRPCGGNGGPVFLAAGGQDGDWLGRQAFSLNAGRQSSAANMPGS